MFKYKSSLFLTFFQIFIQYEGYRIPQRFLHNSRGQPPKCLPSLEQMAQLGCYARPSLPVLSQNKALYLRPDYLQRMRDRSPNSPCYKSSYHWRQAQLLSFLIEHVVDPCK